MFDENPSVAMVMVHRSEIDEFGNIHQLPPFYNQNCVVDGESQAAVFMMAGIAIPGQRMQRASMLNPIKKYKRIFNVAGDWYNNFWQQCVVMWHILKNHFASIEYIQEMKQMNQKRIYWEFSNIIN